MTSELRRMFGTLGVAMCCIGCSYPYADPLPGNRDKGVNAVCAASAAANGVQFGKPDAGLGNARTAALPGGGLVGVRAPMHETEEPVVRPYWLVDDIEAVCRGGS